MIFIIRTADGRVPELTTKMVRQTPAIVAAPAGSMDFFCLGNAAAVQAAGWPVVAVHDGWYADDHGGGVAIWGQGMFWEVRDRPLSVVEACGPDSWPQAKGEADGGVNVRDAIFRGSR